MAKTVKKEKESITQSLSEIDDLDMRDSLVMAPPEPEEIKADMIIGEERKSQQS